MAISKYDLQSLRDEFGALTAEVTKVMEASDQHEADDRTGQPPPYSSGQLTHKRPTAPAAFQNSRSTQPC